jgi:proteasome lid subunit RPN8/RPN11
MGVHLSSNDRQQLLDWALLAGEHECCGLLRGNGDRIAAVQLAQNVAADTKRYFEINPAALITAYKDARTGGLPVCGYFHSHPNGMAEPSATDIAQAPRDGLVWFIVAGGLITAWQPVVSGARVSGFRPVSLIVEG